MKLCNCTQKDLLQNGFHKCGSNYISKITLHKYKEHPVIELDMVVDLEEGDFYYEVVDVCNKRLYSHYYDKEYSQKNKVCRKVKRKVTQKLKELMKNNILAA